MPVALMTSFISLSRKAQKKNPYNLIKTLYTSNIKALAQRFI